MRHTLLFLFVALVYLPQSNAQDLNGEWLAKNLYPSILSGDTKQLIAAFGRKPSVDTPRTGAVLGRKALRAFFDDERKWLESQGVDAQSLAPIKTTRNDKRIVYEFNMQLNNEKPAPHKFGIVVDLRGNQKASTVRVYYGLSNIDSSDDFSRPTMLEENPALLSGIASPVKQYVASIGNAYPDTASVYVDDGCFNAWCGINRHKIFIILMQGGTIPLKLATATCDEMTCALEENLATWGETQFSFNTAGLAVYDYNEKGQLTNARIYDDLHEAPFTRVWFENNWDALNTRFRKIGCAMDVAPQAGESGDDVFGRIFAQPCTDS